MQSARGLTLIETLVVLVIISVIAGSAALTVSHLQRRDFLPQQAALLQDKIHYYAHLALLRGQSILWYRQGSGYAFLCFTRGWHACTKPLSQAYSLPKGLNVNLSPKKILFNPSGTNTPFVITLSDGHHQIYINADSVGNLHVST